jgi:hypothetical protein
MPLLLHAIVIAACGLRPALLARAALTVAAALPLPGVAAETMLRPTAQAAPNAAHYERLQVVSPQRNETVRDNSGRVSIEIELRPRLRTKDGHQLRVMLDGALLPGTWRRPRFMLQDVDRGRHSLQVVVTDASGRHLIESESVPFNMWQASRLLPGRGQAP